MSIVCYAGCKGIEFSRTQRKNSNKMVFTYLTVSGSLSPSTSMSHSELIGHSEAFIKSLNMSCVSFWKMITSPESTRLLGAFSVRKLLRQLVWKEVFALSLPILYY